MWGRWDSRATVTIGLAMWFLKTVWRTDSTNGDPDRSSVVRSPKIVFRRLNYDFEATIQKIYSVPELEPFLGDRLRQGR